MIPVPTQKGRGGLVVQASPLFANYVIIDKSWKAKDATKGLLTDDGSSNPYNFTFWRVGIDAQCNWNIKKGSPAAQVGDVISEQLPLLFSAQPTAEDTIKIGPTTYTFVAALSAGPSVPDQVLIGATLEATLANLVGAVTASATGGQAIGTTYSTGTVVNPAASAAMTDCDEVLFTQLTLTGWANLLKISGSCNVATLLGNALTATPICARAFTIPQDGVETTNFGGMPLEQSVKLAYIKGFLPIVQP